MTTHEPLPVSQVGVAPPVGATTVRRRVEVRGVVQGVGFRPYVHRRATGLGLTGFVGNDGGGVFVEVQGEPDDVDRFTALLADEAPVLAVVEQVESWPVPVDPESPSGFTVVRSRAGGGAADPGPTRRGHL